jgi:hypothetical protein
MSQRQTEYNITGESPKRPLESDITPSPLLDQREKLDVNGKIFVSVKGQEYRYYDVPILQGGTTVRVQIKDPQWLFVREGGAHEVIDAEEVVHYIPKRWVRLAWKNKKGEPLSRF